MFLSNIKLWNFRRFGSDVTTEFSLDKPNLDLQLKEGINVLIGENDSGKTNSRKRNIDKTNVAKYNERCVCLDNILKKEF